MIKTLYYRAYWQILNKMLPHKLQYGEAQKCLYVSYLRTIPIYNLASPHDWSLQSNANFD